MDQRRRRSTVQEEHQATELAGQSAPRLRASPRLTDGSGPHRAVSARLLLVDDEPEFVRVTSRWLTAWGYNVTCAASGEDALRHMEQHRFDVVLTDINMPGMDGMQLLHKVRQHDLHVPVILITGEPAINSAVEAVEWGAFRYLTKKATPEELRAVVSKAVSLRHMGDVRQFASELSGHPDPSAPDRSDLAASFQSALGTLWMAYHPIVNVRDRTIFGYEALVRSDEPSLPHPGALIEAAEQLGSLDKLGCTIRARSAGPMASANDRGVLFVNLHVADLLDPALYAPDAPLSKIADRVVLEITERSSLSAVQDVCGRVSALRELGYRIAVDDLGAGYAGLSSFALLEPEIVKLDMSLVRDVHNSRTKQKLIRSMTSLSQDMGMLVVAEGVEAVGELEALLDLGCDLLQGFLFAKPGRPFPEVKW